MNQLALAFALPEGEPLPRPPRGRVRRVLIARARGEQLALPFLRLLVPEDTGCARRPLLAPAALPAAPPTAPLTAPLVAPTRLPLTGPDPARPCTGCPRRARCSGACPALAALIPHEELRAWNEVGSPALMEGRGYDEAFMCQPEVEEEEPVEELWPKLVAEYGGARLRAAVADLPQTQRLVLEGLLTGKSRRQVRLERQVSRQAVFKVFWAAVRALRRRLGEW